MVFLAFPRALWVPTITNLDTTDLRNKTDLRNWSLIPKKLRKSVVYCIAILACQWKHPWCSDNESLYQEVLFEARNYFFNRMAEVLAKF